MGQDKTQQPEKKQDLTKKGESNSKALRLSEALRQNLLKRKAQKRGRTEESS